MHLQKRTRNKDGRKYDYWELVESYRTARGPRRRSVAYLGVVGPCERLGVKLAAEEQTGNAQKSLFDDFQPELVEVDMGDGPGDDERGEYRLPARGWP